jgi:hypothetical protein
MIVKVYNLTTNDTNWNGILIPRAGSVEYWTNGGYFNYYVTINQDGTVNQGSDIGATDLLVLGISLFLLWIVFKWFINGLSLILGGPKID